MAPADAVTPASRPGIHVVTDSDAVMRVAAEEIVRCCAAAIRARGRFLIALSGGSTPARLYELLAAKQFLPPIDWSRVHVFWGDERCVPPDDPASNYRMVRVTLLDEVPIPATNVHRMRGEDDPPHAAAAYEADLRSVLGASHLDLVLLGLGADGHTASLFPGTAAVHERERWVIAHHVPAQSSWRITLTPVVINASSEVMFLVAGADKAPALQQVLEGPSQPTVLPAQAIHPASGHVKWLVDASAAAQLTC